MMTRAELNAMHYVLPRGVQVMVRRVDEGHEWTTLHNGRVLQRGWSDGESSKARLAARRSLEACGLL